MRKCGSTIYKTISNINIVFPDCLQMRYIFEILFSPRMMKSDYVCQFKENSFSKDFRTGTFNVIMVNGRSCTTCVAYTCTGYLYCVVYVCICVDFRCELSSMNQYMTCKGRRQWCTGVGVFFLTVICKSTSIQINTGPL